MMESSFGSTIEKIKRMEQAEEAKIKEKRDYDAAVYSAERALRDELAGGTRVRAELETHKGACDAVRVKVELARVRERARVELRAIANTHIEELRKRMEQGVSGVWERRASYCSAAQSLSEQCGVSALLVIGTRARAGTEMPARSTVVPPAPPLALTVSERLHAASLRRDRQLAERNRLRVEPEQGDEFVRFVQFLFKIKIF